MRNRKPPDEKTPQGNQSQSGQGDSDDAPKYVTEEQLNRAITARFGDFQKKLDKQIGDLSSSLTSSLVGKLEEVITGKLEGLKPQGGTKEGDGKPALDIDNHPKVKGLERTVEELKSKAQQAEDEKKAANAKSRDQNLRSTLSEALTKGGVDPTRVRHAVGILVDVDKRVRFADDESDELVFKDATGDVDLQTGIKGWLKGDDAKIFMPARGTQGSGDRSQGKGTQNGQQQTTSVGSALLGMARGVMGENPNG